MRAINHALTGALIGLAVGEPLVAAPAAFASHFVCDAIPHFGIDGTKDIRARWFAPLLVIDAILCFGLVVILAVTQPKHWLLAAVCAFLAASPDLFSAPRFKRLLRGGDPRPNLKNAFVRFHHELQFERPYGLATEIVWSVGAVLLLMPFFD